MDDDLRPVVYCGEDLAELELLRSLCNSLECSIHVCDLDALKKRMADRWDHVVILDLDAIKQPIDTIQSLKEVNAGIPIFAIATPNRLPLTTAAVMRGNGVDALFWKPIEQWEELYHALDAGFKRIDCWHHSIAQITEIHANPAAYCDPHETTVSPYIDTLKA